MTGEAFGLVGLDVAFLAVGEALLLGLGLVRSPRAALRYGALALVVGWAATGIVTSLALMAGLEVSVAAVVVLLGLVAGGGLILGLVVPGRPEAVLGERSRPGQAVALAGAVVLALALAQVCRRALASGPFDNDVWAFWLPKAKTIAYFGGLDTNVGGFTSYPHPDYPPLAPAMEAVSFKFMGAVDPLLLPVQHWVIAVGFLGGLAGLLAGRVRPAVLWPSLAMLSLLPTFENFVGSSLGDEPLVELFTLAVVAAALWLVDADPRLAALGGLFLAAAVLAKNEGFMLAVVLLLMLVVTGHPRRRYATLLGLIAAPVLALVSWRTWLLANDVHVPDRDYRLQDVFHPDYLGDHVGRLGTALRSMPGYLFDPRNLLLAVPLALCLVAVLLAVGSARRLALFSAGTLVLAFLGYAVIYWIGIPEIHFYLDSSAIRLMTDIGVSAAVLFPLLLTEALAVTQPEMSPRRG